MAPPLDPNQLDQHAREQRAKEAAEAAVQREREAAEARENALRAAVVGHLTRTGESRTLDELASELSAKTDGVQHALERAAKAGTVTESHGR